MPENEPNGSSTLDRALARASTIDWEKVVWLAILVLAVLTRLWQLGDRAMSHDESLHTYYSWQLFDRGNYRHDPMMHGPLLFHVTALMYYLFGVSDLTARLFAVVAGLLLVMSPLLLRKWLGRAGAAATALLLVVSPTVMYYSRYIRHDIPVEVFTAMMLIGFLRFVDTRQGRWIILAFTGAACGITSAEMAYINGFLLLSFLVVALVSERLGTRRTDWLTVALGSVGLGLLGFAAVANTGKLGDVATKGRALREAMQLGFLAAGLCLVWALSTGLLARYRSGRAPARDSDAAVLADLAPETFFRRYAQASQSLMPLISGVVVLALGIAMAAAAGKMMPGGAVYDLTVRLAPIIKLIGGIMTAYGAAALVLGQLVRVVGARANAVLVGVGVLVAAGAVVLRSIKAAPAAGAEAGAAAAPLLSSGIVLAIMAIGALCALYGLFGWLFTDNEERELSRRLGDAPLGAIGVGLAVGLVIYTLLFTTFFTQPDKISGFVDSIKYWIAQQDVVRGDQPWYYYAIMAPMYEFLPFILTVAALLVYSLSSRLRVARGDDYGDPDRPSPAARCFVPMLLAWSIGTWWIYSWAGEKMPWLIVHLVVPMAFIGGRVLADLFGEIDWQVMRARGWQIACLAALAVIVLATWFVKQPFGANATASSAAMAGWLLGLPILGLLLWGIVRVGGTMPRRQALLALAAGGLALLAVFDVHYTLQANFVNDELATEYIVYAHGTPDDKLVYDTLLDMQERLGVDRPLSVAYDDEVSWPFTWYFRDSEFAEAHYMGKKPSGALSEDVALVGSPNYSNFEPYLRDRYYSIEYRRMWWPNEGYKGLTPSAIWRGLRDAKARRNALSILLQRKYTLDPTADTPEKKPLTDWYHHADMRLYVRKDLIEKLWPLAEVKPGFLAGVDTAVAAPAQTKLTIEQVYDTGPDGQPLIAPKGIDVGPDGRLYVVDQGNKRVVVFSQDGTASEAIAAGVLKVAGDPNGEPSAWGVGVGPDGAVYIADTWNHRVLKYVAGQQVWSAGTFGQPPSAEQDPTLLYGPRDVAVGPDGNIYVTDTGNKRIVVLDSKGKALRAFGGSGVELGQFNEPTSLAFDPQTGDLYVADLWNYRIQRFDRDLKPVSEFPVDGWESQEAAHKAYLAVGPGSLIVATDPAASLAWIFDSSGKVLGILDVIGDERGMDQPVGAAVDSAGKVYIASSNSGIVTRYAVQDVFKAPSGAASPPGSPSAAASGSPSPGPTGLEAGGTAAASPTPTAAPGEGVLFGTPTAASAVTATPQTGGAAGAGGATATRGGP